MSTPNLDNLTDEEILKLDPDTIDPPEDMEEGVDSEDSSAESPTGDIAEESSDDDVDKEGVSEDVDAETSEEGALDSDEEDSDLGVDDADAEDTEVDEPEDTYSDAEIALQAEQADLLKKLDMNPTNPHKASKKSDSKVEEKDSTDTTDSKEKSIDYKGVYKQIFAPFKAAKRVVQVQSVDDVKQLMEMGTDYSRKMAVIKPYLRVIKTLERNELIDPDRVNYLIDLSKHDPSAIKKFIKESGIDPMDYMDSDLDEDGEDTKSDYTPNDHLLSEKELALDEALDNIRDTPKFAETVDILTEKWDVASRQIVVDNPNIIGVINDHVSSGIYDKIMQVVEQEKLFGRLDGLSDIDAYKAVGDTMYENGLLNGADSNSANQQANNSHTPSANSLNNTTKANREQSRKRRRSAGIPNRTNTTPQSLKGLPANLDELSDAEIEKLDPALFG